mgnify:CR=1 FL=1|jgi:hypothetical protein
MARIIVYLLPLIMILTLACSSPVGETMADPSFEKGSYDRSRWDRARWE